MVILLTDTSHFITLTFVLSTPCNLDIINIVPLTEASVSIVYILKFESNDILEALVSIVQKFKAILIFVNKLFSFLYFISDKVISSGLIESPK
jgi:hypothetical protein